MRRFKTFVIPGLCVIVSLAAFYAAWSAADAAMRLEQEASGGGQPERPDIRPPAQQAPPPPEQQQEMDDFPAVPVRIEKEQLVPIDPEAKQKAERAVWLWEMSDMARQAGWAAALAAVFLMVMSWVMRRPVLVGNVEDISEEEISTREGADERETDQPDGVPDGQGDSGDCAELPAAGGTPRCLSGILRDLQAEPSSVPGADGEDGEAVEAQP